MIDQRKGTLAKIRTTKFSLLFFTFSGLVLAKLLIAIYSFERFVAIYKKLLSRNSNKLRSGHEKMVFYTISGVSNNVPIKFTCLHKALVAKYLLRSDPTLKITVGVRKEDGKFKAHAWISRMDTIVFGELKQETYIPIWEIA